MKTSVVDNNKIKFWLQILKGSLSSVSVSLVAILIFAVLIRFLNISDNFIMPINQVIKIVSIFVGVFLALKTNRSIGFVKGLLIGLFYTIIAYLVFSILAGNFGFNLTSFTDMVFGSIIGGISGIIIANLKK